MASLPETKRFPLDAGAFMQKNPERQVEYLRELLLELQKMYAEIASVVNKKADA